VSGAISAYPRQFPRLNPWCDEIAEPRANVELRSKCCASRLHVHNDADLSPTNLGPLVRLIKSNFGPDAEVHDADVLKMLAPPCVRCVRIAVSTSSSTMSSSPVDMHQSQSVDRTLKGDCFTHSKTARDASSSISVEMSGRSDVVIRDRAGNILFAVDNAARATTIGKQSGRSAPAQKTNNPPADLDLPAGCEGAFSSYVEPSKAGMIGRCMTGIPSQTRTVS
jgi:hypothetical protein